MFRTSLAFVRSADRGAFCVLSLFYLRLAILGE